MCSLGSEIIKLLLLWISCEFVVGNGTDKAFFFKFPKSFICLKPGAFERGCGAGEEVVDCSIFNREKLVKNAFAGGHKKVEIL